jgi:hypothetical protein
MDFQQMLVPGTMVYDVDGKKIGSVVETSGSYVLVEKGFFLPKDYSIPISAIAEYDDNGLYLAITKDEVKSQNWDQEPDETLLSSAQAASSAGYGTQGTDAAYAGDGTLRVLVHEEHLAATKRVADAGEVTINKQVVSEQETVAMPLTEERVRVEWRAPTGEVTDDGTVARASC